MLYAIVAVLVIILDQWVKYWVAGNIAIEGGIQEIIPGVLSLVNVHNTGAAFGFLSGSNARILFIVICAVFTVGVIVAIATKFISGSVGRWSAVLVVAGGLANCIDRVINGYVQDMFKIDFFDFAIFNVADIFITVFCIVFIIYIIFGGESKSRKDADRPEYDDGGDYDDYEEKPAKRRGKAPVRDFEDDVEPAPRRRKPRNDYEERPVATATAGRSAKSAREESAPAPTVIRPRKPAEDVEVPASVLRKDGVRPSAHKSRYDEEYERFKAARAARQQTEKEDVRVAAPAKPVAKPADPFAEWEKNADKAPAPRAAAMNEPTRKVASVRMPEREEPVAAPEVAPAPAAEPVKKAAADDFSLDDILNEFK